MSKAHEVYLKEIYVCVMFKGTNKDGKKAFAYVGMHLDKFDKLLKDLHKKNYFNPKDYSGLVFARWDGEPNEATKRFMRDKFSFAEDCVQFEMED